MNKDELYELYKLYNEMIIAQNHYKRSINIISCREFIEKEHLFYKKLDEYEIDLSEWYNNDENYNVCGNCNYKFIICNNKEENITHRKKIHKLFCCKKNEFKN